MYIVPTWETVTHLQMKSKIKGMAEQVRLDRLAKSSGKKRRTNHYVGYLLGQEIRHYSLAYGIFRGIPYRSMESNCQNKPSAQRVLEIIHENVPKYFRTKWTLQLIESILDVEAPDQNQKTAA